MAVRPGGWGGPQESGMGGPGGVSPRRSNLQAPGSSSALAAPPGVPGGVHQQQYPGHAHAGYGQPPPQSCCPCCDPQQAGQEQPGCCDPNQDPNQGCCGPQQEGGSDLIHLSLMTMLLLLVASGLGAVVGTYEKWSLPRKYSVGNSDELQNKLIEDAVSLEHIERELEFYERMAGKLRERRQELDPTPSPPTPSPPTPSPPTPLPPTPVPPTPAPPTPEPPTESPPTSEPPTPAPETPMPPTLIPETDAPTTPIPSTAAPCEECPVCPTIAPVTDAPASPCPACPDMPTCPPVQECPTPEPPTPCPVCPDATPSPSTTAPQTATPTTQEPATATPDTPMPATPEPTTNGSAPSSPRRRTAALEHDVEIDPAGLDLLGEYEPSDLEAAFWSFGPNVRRAVTELADDAEEDDEEPLHCYGTKLVGSGGRICKHMNADFMMYYVARHHTFRALLFFLVLLSACLYFFYYTMVTLYGGATPDSAEVQELKSVVAIAHGFVAIWLFFFFAVEYYYFFKFINFFRWDVIGDAQAFWRWFYKSYLASTLLIGFVVLWPIIGTLLHIIFWPLFFILNMMVNPQFQVMDAGQTRMSHANQSVAGQGQGQGCSEIIAELAQMPKSRLWEFLFRDRTAHGSTSRLGASALPGVGGPRQVGAASQRDVDGDSEMGGMPRGPGQHPAMGARTSGPGGVQQFGPHAGAGSNLGMGDYGGGAQIGHQYPGGALGAAAGVSSYPQPSTGVDGGPKKTAGSTLVAGGSTSAAARKDLDDSGRDDDDNASESEKETKKDDKRRRRRGSSAEPEGKERRRRRDKSGGDSEKKEKKRSRRRDREGESDKEDGAKKEKKEKRERRGKKSKKEDE